MLSLTKWAAWHAHSIDSAAAQYAAQLPMAQARSLPTVPRVIDIAQEIIDHLSKNTTASPTPMPFFVPPRQSTSTPTSRVIRRGGTSSAATALANRAPSMWSRRPSLRQVSPMAASSSIE